MIKRFLLSIGLLLLIGGVLSADPYTQTGRATAETETRASALATQAALAKVIPSEGLREIYTADWYSSIEIKDRTIIRKTRKEATIEITIYVNPITLNQAEQKYQSIAIRKLNQAEGILKAMENKTDQAENREENGRLEEAFTLYQQAQANGEEVLSLLENFKDASFQSDQGYNYSAILDRTRSLQALIRQGLQRMEEYAQEVASSQQTQQLFQELEAQKKELKGFTQTLGQDSPFHNASLRPRLEGMLVEAASALERMNQQVIPKYRDLEAALGPDQFYFKNKVQLSLAECREIADQLRQYKNEIRREIRDPYIERQERKRRQAEFWKEVRTFLFTHESQDVLAFRYEFPVTLDQDRGALSFVNLLNGHMRVEGALDGLWLRALTEMDSFSLPVQDKPYRTITQEIGGALGGQKLIGLGLGGDWYRYSAEGELPSRFFAAGYLVGENKNRERADWVLALRYYLPLNTAKPSLINWTSFDARITARIKSFLVMEGRASSKTIQIAPAPGSDGKLAPDDYYYTLNLDMGVGFRFPGPFLWMLRYRNDTTAPFTTEGLGETSTRQRWQLALEYSF